MTAIEVDGSVLVGGGSIVRQAAGYAGLTGHTLRVTNARARRPKPGLRAQHVRAVEAVRDLVGGTLAGVSVGSRTFTFEPGHLIPRGSYSWDIGTAGSTTALALAVLPLLVGRGQGVEIEIRGGVFQDFAPSAFHLQHVLLPLISRMGVAADLEVVRPGYVPGGAGIIRLVVPAAPASLRPLSLEAAGRVRRVRGIALSSHLTDRQVSTRMAESARAVLHDAGCTAVIDECLDDTAAQPGAGFALFADLDGGALLGADGAGAPRRRAETIGASVARQLLAELNSGATLDRFTADQIIPFAALAAGSTTFRVMSVTEHLRTAAWLASLFVGVEVELSGERVVVHGNGPGAWRRSTPNGNP